MTENLQLTIKTYEPGFEEYQAQLGQEVTQEWRGFQQTPAEQLKKSYSGDKFDPSTKFYAFDGDQLVGFMTTSITENEDGSKSNIARCEFPIAKNNSKEIAKSIFNFAIDSLKSKGIEIVESRVSKFWGDTSKFANLFGYEIDRTLQVQGNLDITNIQGKTSPNVKIYNKENDKEKINQFMKENYNLNEQQLEQQFQFIETSDRIIGFFYYEKDGNILCAIAPIRDQTDNNTSVIPNPTLPEIENQQEIRSEILNHVISHAKQKDITTLKVILFGDSLSLESFYNSQGYVTEPATQMFKKKLN